MQIDTSSENDKIPTIWESIKEDIKNMVQIKIFKTEIKPMALDEEIKKLQNEVNKYIKENTTTYDSIYKCYKQKEANDNGMSVIKMTPLLNNTTFMIILELGVLNGLKEE